MSVTMNDTTDDSDAASINLGGSEESMDLEEGGKSLNVNDLMQMGQESSMDFLRWDEEDKGTTNASSPSPPKVSVAQHELESVQVARRVSTIVILLSLGTIGAMGYLFVSDLLDDAEGDSDNSNGDSGSDSELLSEILYPGIAVAMILPVVICFYVYDVMVQRALRKLDKAANKSAAIVNNLFPENVRERVIKEESRRVRRNRRKDKKPAAASPANTVSTSGSMFSNPTASPKAKKATLSAMDLIPKEILKSKPIADFFPHCTVLFADIVGFTAWSSVRDPTDVFTLLESLYSTFDTIARRHNVFKVETIG